MTSLEQIIYSKLPTAIGLLCGIEKGLDLCISTALPPNVSEMNDIISQARTIIEESNTTLQTLEP